MPLAKLAFVDVATNTLAHTRYAGLAPVSFLTLDWQTFLARSLWEEVQDVDQAFVVPAPRAPHLMFEFLTATLSAASPGYRLERVEPPKSFGLPYEYRDPDNNLFISAAAWICPPTCIEPRKCPAIRSLRTWHLPTLVEDECSGYHVEVFYSSPFAYGVAGIPVNRLLQAKLRWSSEVGSLPRRVAVATVSACHGVVAFGEVKGPGL